ncbi:molybdenum cofactor guanylyltransferase [Arundinibacter roseus]|nr:molybdenum cofactor guanylyltransferase [Arundinibacter roseus]
MNEEILPLQGLVLSGGESRRMGHDKGLLTSAGECAWVNQAGLTLQQAGVPVHVMIQEKQRKNYEAVVLPEFSLRLDLPLPVGGPLKGLLSFHALFPMADVLVLPCDMPAVTVELLQELIRFYTDFPEFDAWIFEENKRSQPFPGIYSGRLLAQVQQQLDGQLLPHHSLMYVLSIGKTALKSAPVGQSAAFKNWNSPRDLETNQGV